MAHSAPIDDVQRELIDETARLGPVSGMQIAPEQGAFLTILARALGVRRAVEVGTFTGYSSLSIARGLAEGGTLLCCDVSEEWTAIARRAWDRAGVADRITLRLAPAVETLRALPSEPHLDLAFVDADKGAYRDYAEELIPRLRPGGLLLVDNVLWSGRVLDEADSGEDTKHIRAFNDWLVTDPRVECVLLPVADGLTMAVRR
ncbi:MAG TPA: O-methyltransferase [Candidatus Dormibacteraeota bacterium]|nr:O-methyltransferase [Candidatus Dormibacteraeota bacterium]